jgi:hypothetical protein
MFGGGFHDEAFSDGTMFTHCFRLQISRSCHCRLDVVAVQVFFLHKEQKIRMMFW